MKETMDSQVPEISVIVPVSPDENSDIVTNSLQNIEYPQDKFEVILTKGRCPSKQRNAAVSNSKGKILYFLDSDSIVTPRIFNNILKYYDDKSVAVVGGPNLTPDFDSFIQKSIGVVLGSIAGSFIVRSRYTRIGSARQTTEKELILCNLSMRKDVFINEGGFNEKLYPNEENELLNRLILSGYKLIYDPDIFVYRSRRNSMRRFAWQSFNYGRGRMEQIFINPYPTDFIHLIPILFGVYLFLLIFFHSIFFMLPAIIYILLILVTSFVISIRGKNILYSLLLPSLFLLRHLSYGVGLIWGFVISIFKLKRKVNWEVKIEIVKEMK